MDPFTLMLLLAYSILAIVDKELKPQLVVEITLLTSVGTLPLNNLAVPTTLPDHEVDTLDANFNVAPVTSNLSVVYESEYVESMLHLHNNKLETY